jgi:ATP-dependent DNA helicase RecG
MLYRESETIELKEIVVDDIKQCIVAFVNTRGGTLYIGITDQGEVVGVDNPDQVLLQVNNMLRDAIKPDITMFMQSGIEEISGKEIITATVPASESAIRRMIKETDGESFEELRSLNQDLTFTTAMTEFATRQIEFGANQQMTLKLCSSDKIYTNLGLLLSDQCTHSIKTAVFQDDSMRNFKDRREIGGSLFKQLSETYDFIDRHNQVHSTFNKLIRTDTRDYPEEAVREALLNAIVHREYAMSGSILIKIFAGRMEFISVGGLYHGVEIADIMSGYSICRNPLLAGVFYRLQLIEAYGTGMQRIFESYAGSGHEPTITVTPNVFKIVLPNVNAAAAKPKSDGSLSRDAQLLNYIKVNGTVNRKAVEELFGVSQSAAGRLLRQMVEDKRLIKANRGKNAAYSAVTF